MPNIVWVQYTRGMCIQYASSTQVENQFQHYNLCQLGRDPQKVAEIYCLDYKQQATKKNYHAGRQGWRKIWKWGNTANIYSQGTAIGCVMFATVILM